MILLINWNVGRKARGVKPLNRPPGRGPRRGSPVPELALIAGVCGYAQTEPRRSDDGFDREEWGSR